MIAQIGIPVPLEYPTFDQLSGLFIGAVVMDVTLGHPGSIVGSLIPLLDDSDGIYGANFTPVTPGKAYVAKIRAYTDVTYGTIDTDRAPETVEMQTVDLSGGGGGGGAVSLDAEIASPNILDAAILD